MKALKTGDPCPFCGQPIKLTDRVALHLMTITAELLGLPDQRAEELTGQKESDSAPQQENLLNGIRQKHQNSYWGN